jgi:hypothetical protein
MGRRLAAQVLALLAGTLLVALGIAGLVSHHELFGTFQVALAVDCIHLVLGAAGLAAAASADRSRAYLAGAGVVVFVLWTLGVVLRDAWLSLNPSDNWLHFVFGAALAACVAGTRAMPEPGRACAQP